MRGITFALLAVSVLLFKAPILKAEILILPEGSHTISSDVTKTGESVSVLTGQTLNPLDPSFGTLNYVEVKQSYSLKTIATALLTKEPGAAEMHGTWDWKANSDYSLVGDTVNVSDSEVLTDSGSFATTSPTYLIRVEIEQLLSASGWVNLGLTSSGTPNRSYSTDIDFEHSTHFPPFAAVVGGFTFNSDDWDSIGTISGLGISQHLTVTTQVRYNYTPKTVPEPNVMQLMFSGFLLGGIGCIMYRGGWLSNMLGTAMG